MAQISDLLGKVAVNVVRRKEEIYFLMTDGTLYLMYHHQD